MFNVNESSLNIEHWTLNIERVFSYLVNIVSM